MPVGMAALGEGRHCREEDPSSGCSSRLPEARVLQSPWRCVACGSTHVGVEGPALLAPSHPQGLLVPAVRTALHQALCQHPLPGPTWGVMLPGPLHPSFEVIATGLAGRHGHLEGTPGPLASTQAHSLSFPWDAGHEGEAGTSGPAACQGLSVRMKLEQCDLAGPGQWHPYAFAVRSPDGSMWGLEVTCALKQCHDNGLLPAPSSSSARLDGGQRMDR